MTERQSTDTPSTEDCQAARSAVMQSDGVALQRGAAAVRAEDVVTFYALSLDGRDPGYRPPLLGEARRLVYAEHAAAEWARFQLLGQRIQQPVVVVELDHYPPWCDAVVQADDGVVPVLGKGTVMRAPVTGFGCLPAGAVAATGTAVFGPETWRPEAVGVLVATVIAWVLWRTFVTRPLLLDRADQVAAILVGLPKAMARRRSASRGTDREPPSPP